MKCIGTRAQWLRIAVLNHNLTHKHSDSFLLSFLFFSLVFLGFSQMLHRSERWTMKLFSGRVGGQHSERGREMGFESRWWKVGKVLVIVSLEDHETRSGNGECQVEVEKHCTTKQSINFTSVVIHVNWVLKVDGSIYLMCLLFVLNI